MGESQYHREILFDIFAYIVMLYVLYNVRYDRNDMVVKIIYIHWFCCRINGIDSFDSKFFHK